MARDKLPDLAIGVLVVSQLLFTSVPKLWGQAATTGAIQGTVTDTSGAVVPGADVEVINRATGRKTTASTGSSGFYSVEGLLAGPYDITVRKEGFKTQVATGLKLDPGERRGYNVTLSLGTVQQQVTVNAAIEKVQTESGEQAGVIAGEQVQNLLLNGRNYMGLAALIPGVNLTSGSAELGGGGLATAQTISVNGLGVEFTSFQLDGAFNVNAGSYGNANLVSTLDTVAEFRILKNNYSARYGISGSAIVLVETKSGTQEFHGSAYNYLRNDALDASNFFARFDPLTGKKDKTPLKQNIFGYTIGGPFFIPGKYNTNRRKTFFFVNEEWRRRRVGLTLRGALPTAAMRAGDFRSSPTLPATGLQLDSSSQSILAQKFPARFGPGGNQCFLGPNQLDPACFDQNAVLLINHFWPLPNNPGAGFLNYINPGREKIDQREDTIRVDHYFSDKMRLIVRWSNQRTEDTPPALNFSVANVAPPLGVTIPTHDLHAVIRAMTNISPTAINQFTASTSHCDPLILPLNAELPSGVTIRQVFPNANRENLIPQITLGKGWSPMSAGALPVDAGDTSVTLADDVSIVKGKHVFQFGLSLLFGSKRQNIFGQSMGSFFYGGLHAGDPVADFLLGLYTSYSQQDQRRRGYFRYDDYEPYVQDDWKVTPTLTLNLGLRYVYITPNSIQHDRYTNFDPKLWDTAIAPAVQPNGTFVLDSQGRPLTPDGKVAQIFDGLDCPGVSRVFGDPPYICPTVPRGVWNAYKRGFAPRFGFAWDPFGSGRTSIRGGYGIGYNQIPYGQYESMNNPPFVQTVALLNGTLTDPTLGAVAAAKTPVGLNWLNPNAIPTMVQTWSLGVQHEMVRNLVFDVFYVGSGARGIPGQYDLNFPLTGIGPSINNPKCLQAGQDPAGTFQFDPCLNANLVSANFTRPFRGWGGFSTSKGGSFRGTSNYHSLQVGTKYRPGAHLTLTLAYTWGKAMTNVATAGGSRNSAANAQNPRQWNLEYGRAPFDRTHIFTAGYIYDLPFLRNRSGMLGVAFGNWTFSGITYIQSGFFFDPVLATSTAGLARRADRIGNPSEAPKTVQQYFNTAAFKAPPFGFFGNSGRGIIRGPGEQTWNWALFKTFPIRERAKLQFRSEFFNVFNHTNFRTISTGLGAGNFGQVTSAMDPRILEFALRLDF